MKEPNYAAILADHIQIPAPDHPGETARILRDLDAALRPDGIDIDQAAAATRKAADDLQDLAVKLRGRSSPSSDEWADTALAMGALRTANVAMWRADYEASLTEQRKALATGGRGR